MKRVEQIEEMLGDIEFAFRQINESLNDLELVDWHEIFSHVPDSDRIHGEIESAIDNIRQNLNELDKGVY